MILAQEQFAQDYDSFGMNQSETPYNEQDGGLSTLETPAEDPINPGNFSGGGTYKDLSVQKLVIGGGKQITIDTTGDIQSALDEINTAGGGVLHLSPGIYLPKGSISVYSTISIRGLNQTDTIIDFGGNAYNFQLVGTDTYTDGTIASISGGVNVTGSSTAWTSDMIGRQIFIDERWYIIANVLSATSLTLTSGYADGATFSGSYRIANPILDVTFQHLTIKNSAATAISATDVRDLSILNCTFLDNNKGFTLTNFMNVIIDTVSNISATSNGYELTNGTFCNNYSHASVSNGGHGAVLVNTRTSGWILSACDSNTNNGFDIDVNDSNDLLLNVEAASNGGDGISIHT